MKSVMSHTFSQAPSAEIPRSRFDRTHGLKTTFNAGFLVPVLVDEVLPGDTFHVDMTCFCRMATPIFPLMDNLKLDSFFFFVPNRLLWSNWQRFNGEQPNPGDSTDFLVPQITSPAGGYLENTVYDYMGLPTKIAGLAHSALWLRAYNLIWNEWYRDENLQTAAPRNMGDGPDAPTDYVLLRRGKRHDYFTSALPWPQKGPSVTLPLGTSAPIYGDGKAISMIAGGATLPRSIANNSAAAIQTGATQNADLGQIVSGVNAFPNGAAMGLPTKASGYESHIYTDLTSATAATINQLRQAFQVQRLYERDARGGTRYTEILRAHFGVTSPDARLQRPEFLGGGTTSININPVAQTSAAASQPTPIGTMSAFGTASASGHGFHKSFVEHGVIIGLVCVRADLTYQQGLNRMWSRRTRFDFYWPALSHLGEQAILNKEIYAQGAAAPAVDAAAFGYQEAWAEYRYKPSQICGLFRSNASGTLDPWHLAQNFASLPTLNNTFIVENPPVSRVIAVPTQPQFLMDTFFSLQCTRPLPVYSVPGLIDHF